MSVFYLGGQRQWRSTEGDGQTSVVSVPEHLVLTSWLDFEEKVALNVLASVEEELHRLSQKATSGRVHDARVALRRWNSIWLVLKDDGWSNKTLRKLLKQLRMLRRALGQLRDLDVNISHAEELSCPETILSPWRKQQKKQRRDIASLLEKLEPPCLLAKLEKALRLRVQKLRQKLDADMRHQSAYLHLNHVLLGQEGRVAALEKDARAISELHALRLEIKRWRYLLTEFFGLTNIELVRAQQHLGRLNDNFRLQSALGQEAPPALLQALDLERQELLEQFEALRGKLPYGLRPSVTSFC